MLKKNKSLFSLGKNVFQKQTTYGQKSFQSPSKEKKTKKNKSKKIKNGQDGGKIGKDTYYDQENSGDEYSNSFSGRSRGADVLGSGGLSAVFDNLVMKSAPKKDTNNNKSCDFRTSTDYSTSNANHLANIQKLPEWKQMVDTDMTKE